MVERKTLVAVLLIAGFVVAAGYVGGLFSNPDEQVTTTTTSSSPSCWSTYQHNFQRTGYSNDEVPMSNITLWVNPDVTGAFAAPIVADDKVFKYSGGYTFTIDALSNSTLWKTASSIGVQPQLTYHNGVLLQGSRSTGLIVYDAITGSRSDIHASPVLSGGAGAPIVDDNDVVYFGENHYRKLSPSSPDSTFYAFNITTKMMLWNFSLLDRQIGSSPAIDDDRIFFIAGDSLYALDSIDGNQLWTFRTLSGSWLGGVSASGNMVFTIGTDRYVYALNQFDGSIVWETQIASSISYPYAPAVGGGRVFAGSDGEVYALDFEDGQILWTSDLGETIFSSLTVSGGLVFAGSDSGGFFALEEENGSIVWSIRLQEGKVSSAAVCNGMIYIASNEGIRAIGDTKP